MRFRGQNPVYKYGDYTERYDNADQATYTGVVAKTGFILGIIAVVALYFAYTLEITSFGTNVLIPLLVAPIIAIIAIIVTHRNPAIAMFSSIVYAICEGVFLGFISGIVAWAYGGEIVQTALIGTFGVLGGMLFLYSTGIIRVGNFFRRAMFAMLIGLVLSSLVLLVLAFTNVQLFSGLYFGIVVLSVIISSLYLLVDFDNITRYVEGGAPKQTEWSLSLGLAVTLVWLYVEILRLLVIIAGRRR